MRVLLATLLALTTPTAALLHARLAPARVRTRRLVPLCCLGEEVAVEAAELVEVARVEAGGAQQLLRSKRQLAAFGLPISFLFLSNFALGAVDTAAVARCGGLSELAALAPGTASMEYSCYVLSALTSVIFNNLASIPMDTSTQRPEREQWNEELRPALGVALLVGAMHATIFTIFAPSIALLCGAPPQVHMRTALYLRWRVLGALTFQYTSISSAAFYAVKDSATPFHAVLIAVLVNILGDVLLCPKLGIAGAAAATSLAQICSCLFLRRKLESRGLAPPGPVLAMPPPSRVARMLKATAPHGVVCTARTAFYILLGRWCCQLGVTASAAQQIASVTTGTESQTPLKPDPVDCCSGTAALARLLWRFCSSCGRAPSLVPLWPLCGPYVPPLWSLPTAVADDDCLHPSHAARALACEDHLLGFVVSLRRAHVRRRSDVCA